MSDRWVTILWMAALIGVCAIVLWPSSDTSLESRPLSTDSREAGIAGLVRWLAASGVETASLRQRFDKLSELSPSERGNIFIVHVPMLLVPEAAEVHALHEWVAAGNTVVVSSALMESPAWHLSGTSVIETTTRLTDIEFQIGDAEDPNDAHDPRSILDVPAWVALSGSSRTVELVGVNVDPLADNFSDVQVPWDGTFIECCDALSDIVNVLPGAKAGLEQFKVTENSAWQAILAQREPTQTVAWKRQLGAGSIIVLGHPSILANAAIHEHGNRQFAINLIATYLGPTGRVLFDDAHQGSNDLFTADNLLSDIRVLYTFGFLLLCWAVYLLADAGTWERLTKARRHVPRGQADLVRASGGYLARRLDPAAAIAGVLEPLRLRLAKKWDLSEGSAIEQGLKLERVNNGELAERVHNVLDRAPHRVDLVKLHNAVQALRHDMH